MKSWIVLGTILMTLGLTACQGKGGDGKKNATTTVNNNCSEYDRYHGRCDYNGDSCQSMGYRRNGNYWYDVNGYRVQCYDEDRYGQWNNEWGFPIGQGEFDRCFDYYGGGAFTIVLGGRLYCMAPNVIPIGFHFGLGYNYQQPIQACRVGVDCHTRCGGDYGTFGGTLGWSYRYCL